MADTHFSHSLSRACIVLMYAWNREIYNNEEKKMRMLNFRGDLLRARSGAEFYVAVDSANKEHESAHGE